METLIQEWLAQARQHRRLTQHPLVTLSYAQSLDGCLTVRRGQPTALSGPESSRLTHWLRSQHDAILVGVGTVLADNPRLTVRLVEGRNPQPVILDSQLRTPTDANLLRGHPHPAWIAASHHAPAERRAVLEGIAGRMFSLPANENGKVSLLALLAELAEAGIASLMVEGGGEVITSFLAQGLVDQMILTIAPVILAGYPAITSSAAWPVQEGAGFVYPRLKDARFHRLGEDIVVLGKLK
jgi:3,4-dihydroxy 2-butanone 4-phosphate synthase/GTP cyclohydrolase II